jgi:hypothetical protein
MIPIMFLFALIVGATLGWVARSQRAPQGFAVIFRDLATAAGRHTSGEGRIVRLSKVWGVQTLTPFQINEALSAYLEGRNARPQPDPRPQDIGRCTAHAQGKRCPFLAAPGSRYCNVCLSGGH